MSDELADLVLKYKIYTNKQEFELCTRSIYEKTKQLDTITGRKLDFDKYQKFSTLHFMIVHILDSITDKAALSHKVFAIEGLMFLTPEKLDKFLKITPKINTEEVRTLKAEIIELWIKLLTLTNPKLSLHFNELFNLGIPHTDR